MNKENLLADITNHMIDANEHIMDFCEQNPDNNLGLLLDQIAMVRKTIGYVEEVDKRLKNASTNSL